MHPLSKAFPPGAIQEFETLLEVFKGKQVYLVDIYEGETRLRIATVAKSRVCSLRTPNNEIRSYLTMLSEGRLIPVYFHRYNLEGLTFKSPGFIFGEYACAEEYFYDLENVRATNKK